MVLVAFGIVAYIVSPLNSGTDIHSFKFSVQGEIQEKLDNLSPIKVERNSAYFSIECRHFGIGTHSYYVTSKGTSRYDEVAIVGCPTEMQYLDCPDFTVTYDENQALVDVLKGYRKQFSAQTVKNCATSAILFAPTTLPRYEN